MPVVHVSTRPPAADYDITLSRGILSQTGNIARHSLGPSARTTALISNKKVFSLYGRQVVESLESSGFSVHYWLMGDGERFKSVATAHKAINFFQTSKLDRSDGVIALGGGVVGDVVGFASAIYLRGISVIQIPTTLVAQVDSSVGGKTGVNTANGKNLIGSFHHPRGVIIDVDTLGTLPERELTAGWCEMVKQGAIANKTLFVRTTDFLRYLGTSRDLNLAKLSELIALHIAFKTRIVAGDEREDTDRDDHRSRKILNFGHTTAHALESVTNYGRFRHGEAVGHGMLVAGTLSTKLGLLEESELELLRDAVALCGPLPSAATLDIGAVISAITRDKKRASGLVQWVLLERIGHPRLVDGKEISQRLLRESLVDALKNYPAGVGVK